MTTPAPGILFPLVKKLGHPVKEIRERALHLLKVKLSLGWEFDDEITGVRELMQALLLWFDLPQPSLHKDVLDLLHNAIKTEAGSYIVRQLGVANILSRLNKIKTKVEKDAMETFEDVVETLKFVNTVESEENINVPPLALGSLKCSENEEESSGSYYKLGNNVHSSSDTLASDEVAIEKKISKPTQNDGIKVLLLPWVNLCTSDLKTICLVEDALKIVKSTRRCCRFIRDVFLRDFPVEILLNRPKILQHLLQISDTETGSQIREPLHVLLCVTQTLRERLRQLACLELISDITKDGSEKNSGEDRINVALVDIAGVEDNISPDDQLAALRQMPVPLYAIDTLHTVLSLITRIITSDSDCEPSCLRELNICSDFFDCLAELLFDCVNSCFWSSEHDCKTKRDIAHKSFMVMRSMGELIELCRKTYQENTDLLHYRALWVRLLSCSERLLNWARDSVTQPTSLIKALQFAQLDPALEILYPSLNKRVAMTLQIVGMDQDHKSKYAEMTKLTASMEEAVCFIKNKNSVRNSKKVYQCIKNSLPSLEFHLNEQYLDDVIEILLERNKDFKLDENDWSVIRCIALKLMAHNLEWVREKFYEKLYEMLKIVLSGDEALQDVNEKRLTLLCDVGLLTEICCHGISAEYGKISHSASAVMLYLLRGRLMMSEPCWWQVLASLLPVLPLLHAYAAHDTELGKAICKSLETDIAECMGVSLSEVTMGWVRLLFVNCPAVNMDAAISLCLIMDDETFLPPKEVLRAHVLINALSRVKSQDFNISSASSASTYPETTSLVQLLDVLKQDLVLDEHGSGFIKQSGSRPTLEPFMRRSTLQQLTVLMQRPELHETFVENDGVKIVVALLRMSLMVDDYLAFPECAISCVSVLNSVCFTCRYTLAKTPGLALLLLRVILVFPSDESAVQMSAQCLAMIAWSGFVLQELDTTTRRRVAALPHCVIERTKLPFAVNSYWNTSPNTERSTLEWLMSEEEYRVCLCMRWWVKYEGGHRVVGGAPPPPAPPAHLPAATHRLALQHTSPTFVATKALLTLENATSHQSVNEALNLLISYTQLVSRSNVSSREFCALPWRNLSRFLSAPPASARDTALLTALLQFVLVYVESVPSDDGAMSWITSSFIGNDAQIITLLAKTELYPQMTSQDQVELIQLQIYIVKVVLRCVMLLEWSEEYKGDQLESLIKILLACLERVDLKNFHMLGFLNELVRCIRYALNSRYCKLSESTLILCLKTMTKTLSGCTSGNGCKGHACRLDVTISLLALLKHIHDDQIPVQRWSEHWSGCTVCAVVRCARGPSAELRAAAIYVINALAQYTYFMPHLIQAIEEESLCGYACAIFCEVKEANVVRTAAACLLGSITSRASPHSDVLQCDVLNQFNGHEFLEACIEILVSFCNENHFRNWIEPNLPMSLLERRNELEVRAKKCGDVHITPSAQRYGRRPPTVRLVAAVADVLHNVSLFPRWPVKEWNERGVYRLLFRCASWSHGEPSEVYCARAAVCRALNALTAYKCVRTTLSTTKDCLYNLIATVTPIEEEICSVDCVSAHAQALLLLGSLVSERAAADALWEALREKLAVPVFHSLLQAVSSDFAELHEAGLLCLTQLVQSIAPKHVDQGKHETCVKLLDNLKSPFDKEVDSGRKGAGDSARECDPEYMVEELCRTILQRFEKLVTGDDLAEQEDAYSRVCSCLSSLLSASERVRLYCVHRQLPRALVTTIRVVRDKCAIRPDENVKNASNLPMLRILYWLLTVANCQMLDCLPAKEAIADEKIAPSLNRLWPWCMLTEQLREAMVHMILTFCNDCPKAWGGMSTCVAGRTLIGEVCALTLREAALQSRTHTDTLLLLCLRILKIVMPHHHCRAIILKSEVLNGVFRSRVRERDGGGGAVGAQWAVVWGAAARWPEGAAAALALRPLPAAKTLRPLLLPALAYFAAHRRSHLLHSGELLDLLTSALLAGDVGEIVSAARAVWTLAANNHKAKLLLRSAGVSSAAQAALQRMQRLRDESAQRAVQLLIYVNTVLQAI